MPESDQLEDLLNQDERHARCTVIERGKYRSTIYRRVRNGYLTRPMTGLIARTEQWARLSPPERMLHIARALNRKHPDWIFTGVAAAAAYELYLPWSACRLPLQVVRACKDRHDTRCIQYVVSKSATVKSVNGIRVCSPSRILQDCAGLPFHHALPIFDSALQHNLDIFSDPLEIHEREFLRLLQHADAASGSGGESCLRAFIIEFGFEPPILQHHFYDSQTNISSYADFMWVDEAGHIIVVEFDGAQKYVDPAMAGSRDILEVVRDQEARTQRLMRCGVDEIHRFKSDILRNPSQIKERLMEWGVPMRVRR
ncbi:hypothetical protein [Bifidobacterium magnum]|uniref:CTP synthase n=1 Tax=Bifidobacterium magnum TaxID=1692 RepID=A0A087BB45_9BIFI|nr:hypothetical protein [Bifidobacterium magnum]KFI68245.1 hypothetical protein BMAGN_0196 [Bifidobacterium magnum]